MGISSLLVISILLSQRHCKAFFLHDGCLIKEHYSTKTLEDSIRFLMLFPPKDEFFLSITQNMSTSRLYPPKAHEGPQTWMQMDLRLSDSIEMRFQNGTAWMKGANPVQGILLKSVSFSFGLLAPNCPQKRPFWTLREKAASLQRDLRDNQDITFSLVSTDGSLVYLEIGREDLLLCRDTITDQLVVGFVKSVGRRCQPLPPLQTIWLRVEFKEGLVTLSRPDDAGRILRSFSLHSTTAGLSFKTKRITGEVYVVEHVDGYPEPSRVQGKEALQREETSTAQNELVWVWVFVSVVCILFLMLSVAVWLSFVFYSRWLKAKEVLLLLRKGSLDAGREGQGAPGTTKDNFYTPPPVVPPLPLPLLARSPEDQYLTPRKNKTLDEAEHVYEEVGAVAKWSSAKEAQGKANEAFEKVLPKRGSCDGIS